MIKDHKLLVAVNPKSAPLCTYISLCSSSQIFSIQTIQGFRFLLASRYSTRSHLHISTNTMSDPDHHWYRFDNNGKYPQKTDTTSIQPPPSRTTLPRADTRMPNPAIPVPWSDSLLKVPYSPRSPNRELYTHPNDSSAPSADTDLVTRKETSNPDDSFSAEKPPTIYGNSSSGLTQGGATSIAPSNSAQQSRERPPHNSISEIEQRSLAMDDKFKYPSIDDGERKTRKRKKSGGP